MQKELERRNDVERAIEKERCRKSQREGKMQKELERREDEERAREKEICRKSYREGMMQKELQRRKDVERAREKERCGSILQQFPEMFQVWGNLRHEGFFCQRLIFCIAQFSRSAESKNCKHVNLLFNKLEEKATPPQLMYFELKLQAVKLN